MIAGACELVLEVFCSMRTEQQVLNSILKTALSEDSVRVVYMNGSRVNSNAPLDNYRDYDVVFAVTSVERFIDDQAWIYDFGELVIKQYFINPMNSSSLVAHAFLMQSADGVRIDLHFKPLVYLDEILSEDTLTMVLLDKDNRIGHIFEPHDRGWFITRPTAQQYYELLNQLWWMQAYVAKGICRDELPYAWHSFNYIHIGVVELLSWHVCAQHDWQLNLGASGEWLKRYMPKDIYDSYVRSLPSAPYEELWQSLFNSQQLIRQVGIAVAKQLNYQYPQQEDDNVSTYVEMMRRGCDYNH